MSNGMHPTGVCNGPALCAANHHLNTRMRPHKVVGLATLNGAPMSGIGRHGVVCAAACVSADAKGWGSMQCGGSARTHPNPIPRRPGGV